MCGDIHGELVSLVYDLTERYKIDNADILVLGDFGAGFGGPNSLSVLYDRVKKRLEKHDIVIHAIRGNHDDPSFFDGQHDYERLKLLPDHVVVEICGKKIYPVGGAVSVDVDRKDAKGMSRRDYNNKYKRFGSSRRCWWEDEAPVEKMKGLPVSVDIIVSHDAPLGFDPVPLRPEDVSFETWEKILACRRYLDHVQYEVRAKWWFYGHHHHSFSGHIGDLKYRGLGINELFEVLGE